MTSANDSAYRDRSGRRLVDYPRPSVAVDTALLTVLPGTNHLSVLLVAERRTGGWALPGTFIHEGERLIDAVKRSLLDKAGVTGVRPRQLHVFDDPARDNRGWVLSVAHVDVVREARLAKRDTDSTRLAPVTAVGRLPHGHADIIKQAVAHIRDSYAAQPDPHRLLSEPFTVLQLRQLHEAVAGHELQRDTFRRLMEPHLAGTGDTTSGTRGRPAELFRHATKPAGGSQ